MSTRKSLPAAASGGPCRYLQFAFQFLEIAPDLRFHFTDFEQGNEDIDEKRAGRRWRSARVPAAPRHFNAENIPGGLGQERQELAIRLVAGVAAARSEDAGLVVIASRAMDVAGITEQAKLRRQHDDPGVPVAAVWPIEAKKRARAEAGRIESLRLVAERALEYIVEPEWVPGDTQWKQLLAGAKLFRLELEGFEHAKTLLPLKMHAPDKHRNAAGAQPTRVRPRQRYGFRPSDAAPVLMSKGTDVCECVTTHSWPSLR